MFDYAALSDNELQALASGGESAAEEALVKRYLPLVQACAWPMKLFVEATATSFLAFV